CQRRDVIEIAPIVEVQADMIPEASRDHPRPQDVLHRLTETEIGRQRKPRDQVRETPPRAGPTPRRSAPKTPAPSPAGPTPASWPPPPRRKEYKYPPQTAVFVGK